MINSVREKVSFTINGLPNMQLFSFCLFHFSKFQMTIIKDFMEKPIEDFIIRFHGCYEVLLSDKYFWSTFFWQWNNDPFNFFFLISTEMHLVSLFLLNERNITVSLLMIHLKCTVVHFANLNWSSLNEHYLRAVEYAISFFFRFTIHICFNETFTTFFMKKLTFFNKNFRNSFRDVVYYRILGCQTLWC